MVRRPPEATSLVRRFATQIQLLVLILLAFYLFIAVDGPQRFGEWFAQFYQPGR